MAESEAVYERIEVVLRVLQARRARRAVASPALDRATAAIVALRGDAARDGISAAFDGIVDALRSLASGLDDADRREIDGALATLTSLERDVLRVAQSERAHRPGAELDRAPRFLTASGATPALHPEEARPPADGERATQGADRHATAHLESIARDAIEEIASLSLLRAGADDGPWSGAEAFERRLLASLDAVRAYARGRRRVDVDALAMRLARDYPVVERSRWFAALFLLACTAGERATSALRQAILELPPAARAAAVDALALGSNPRLGAVAVSLLEEDDRPELLEIGLAATARLGVVDVDAALALVDHPSDRIASQAARALLGAPVEQTAPPLVELLDRRGASLDAAFVLAARGAEVGLQHLRIAATAGGAEGAPAEHTTRGTRAARLLALFGRDRDVDLLGAAAERDVVLVEALADHGAPAFLAPLRAALARDRGGASDARAEAASRALVRMTGIAPPWPGLPDGRIDVEAYAKEVGRFQAPLGARRLVAGGELDVPALVRELADEQMPGRDRPRAAQRLVAVTGAPLAFDAEGWVAAQRAALDRLSGALAPARAIASQRGVS